MVLQESKNLEKARKMLENKEILDMNNAIWFAKYLINEYVINNDMQLLYCFTPNMKVGEYIVDSLGVYRSVMIHNLHDELVSNSMKFNGEMSLENLLWYYFLSLGNDVVVYNLSNNMVNNIYPFDNSAGYTIKQYLIYKESLIANTISGDFLNRYKDCWFNFSEASIIGGTIFLDIVKDNFDDCTILNGVKDYFEKRVNAYKLNEIGSVRWELTRAVDSIIKTHADRFITSDSDLLLEFNEDGSKRDFFGLMDVRRKNTEKLERQLEYYDNEIIKEKIRKCLEDKDILFGELVYNALIVYDDDYVNEILKTISDDDLLFIEKSVASKMLDVENILEFIDSLDICEKDELFNDWKFEEADCMRLSYMIEQVKGKKKAILK